MFPSCARFNQTTNLAKLGANVKNGKTNGVQFYNEASTQGIDQAYG